MSLQFQPVRVATNSDDSESQLVFRDGLLVAVLVQLSEAHGDDAGHWFLKVGFGRLNHPVAPNFATLDDAGTWIERHLEPAIYS